MTSPSILLVEDNPVQQRLLSMLAEQAGVTPHVVSSGIKALEAYDRCHDFQLILMDWHMPDMDGLECTSRIRLRECHGKHIPIIGITANAMPGDRERCIEAGMDDYLSKPFTLEQFTGIIHVWLDKARDTNR